MKNGKQNSFKKGSHPKQKHDLDKIYTKPSQALKLISELNLPDFDIIFEPSAGNGSFSNQIKNCIAIDIDPEQLNIKKENFLTSNYNFDNKKVLVIGNPPFGKQNSLAIKFFNKASLFANTIAFILPKTFKKDSIKDKLNLNFHLIKQINIYETFLLNGKDFNVPCLFQIWEKQNIKRKKTVKLIPKSFGFVKYEDNPDYAIRRVGVNAGKIVDDYKNTSKSSHYYVITDDKNFKDRVGKIKWGHDNTVGPRSISKNELIKKIDY